MAFTTQIPNSSAPSDEFTPVPTYTPIPQQDTSQPIDWDQALKEGDEADKALGTGVLEQVPTPTGGTSSQITKVQNLGNPTNAKAATASATQVVTDINSQQAYYQVLTPASEVVVEPGTLVYGPDNYKYWNPSINGKKINKVIYDIGEATAGIRTDIISLLQFHYPMIRTLGYQLTKFELNLKAYDQESLDELVDIYNSLYPKLFPAGNRLQKPKVTKFIYPPMNQRGLYYVIPIEPSSGFIHFNRDFEHTCKFTLLQWQPVSLPAFVYPDLINNVQLAPPTGNTNSANNYGGYVNNDSGGASSDWSDGGGGYPK